MKRLAVALAVLCLSGAGLARTISFVGEGFDPSPEQEVTLYIQTDTPLLCLGAFVHVSGDATITGVMNEYDSGSFGWDPGWTGQPYVDDVNGFAEVCGVKLTFNSGETATRTSTSNASTGSGTGQVVGYVTFVYHSGQVSVSMIGDSYGTDYESVETSSQVLTFGQPVARMSMSSRFMSLSRSVAAVSVEEEAVSTDTVESEEAVADTPPDPYAEFQRCMHPQGYDADTAGGLAMAASLAAPTAYDANFVMTQNTVWDHDVTLNGALYVEGCELVIMPGVTVWNEGGQGGIVVRSNGVIIASGTNQNRVGFAANTSSYDFAVKIESTASARCAINNCVVMFAREGIWIENRRLDSPLQQMTIVRCGDGIHEEGPNLTDILNNEMIQCSWSGIEVYLTDMEDPNNTCSAYTHINIEHNSVIGYWTDYESPQYYGMTIHGSPDSSKAGYVAMADNLIAGSAIYAVNMGDGAIVCEGRKNHGYYNNEAIDSGDPWGDIDPKVTWDSPFYYYSISTWPHLLKPDCLFVDGGYKSVAELGYLIGQTTYFGVPDVNVADIGVHYNFEGYVNAGINPLAGDINNDLGVDANDLKIVVDHWLEDGNSVNYLAAANLYGDDRIDMQDMAVLAGDWQMRTSPIPPDAPVIFDQATSGLHGNATASINMPSFAYRAYVLLDGKPVGDITANGVDPNALSLDTRLFANGVHSMKLAYLCDDGSVFLTSPASIVFDNDLSMLVIPDSIEAGRNLCCYGISDSNQPYSFEMRDLNDTVVFSQSCQGGMNVQVPAADVSDAHGMYSMSISQVQSGGGLMFAAAAGSDAVERCMARKFDPNDAAFANARMVISIGSVDILARNANYVTLMRNKVKAAISQNLDPIVLPYQQCTFETMRAALGMPNVKLWDHTSHADDSQSGRTRHSVEIKGSRLYSYLAKDYPDPATPPSEYQKLGKAAEGQHTVTELGIITVENQKRKCKLNWVSFTGCWTFESDYSGVGEFPSWLGIYQTEPGFPPEKVFIGWRCRYFDESANTAFPLLLYDIALWESLGAGRTVSEAQQYSFDKNSFSGAVMRNILNNWRYYGPDMEATKLTPSLK
jgi:hypothetical protein